MAIFHGRYPSKNSDGVDVPSLGLKERGPIVKVSVGPTQKMVSELTKAGLKVPATRNGLAMIDTGSVFTCIDESVARELGFIPLDVTNVASASHASHQVNIYVVNIEFVGFGVKLDTLRTVGASLKHHDLIALIGRDFLSHCTFFYNGPMGEITISI